MSPVRAVSLYHHFRECDIILAVGYQEKLRVQSSVSNRRLGPWVVKRKEKENAKYRSDQPRVYQLQPMNWQLLAM